MTVVHRLWLACVLSAVMSIAQAQDAQPSIVLDCRLIDDNAAYTMPKPIASSHSVYR